MQNVFGTSDACYFILQLSCYKVLQFYSKFSNCTVAHHIWTDFLTLYTMLATVAYSDAVLGSSQAVLWTQLNFSSSPEVYMIKHIPPVRSDLERDNARTPQDMDGTLTLIFAKLETT